MTLRVPGITYSLLKVEKFNIRTFSNRIRLIRARLNMIENVIMDYLINLINNFNN